MKKRDQNKNVKTFFTSMITTGQSDLAKGRIATTRPPLHGLYIVYSVPLPARKRPKHGSCCLREFAAGMATIGSAVCAGTHM